MANTITKLLRLILEELRIIRHNTGELTEKDPVLTLPEDTTTQTGINNQSGVLIEPKEDLDGIVARLSKNVSGLEQALLKRNDGTVIERQGISHLGPGDRVRFSSPLYVDETYQLIAWASAEDYERGKATEVEYPIEGDYLSVTGGVYHSSGSVSTSNRYNFDQIRVGNGGREATGLDDTQGVTRVNVLEEVSIDERKDLSAEIRGYINGLDTVNHEFVLPEGRYLWNSPLVLRESYEHLGIVGDRRATLEVRNHDLETCFRAGTWTGDNSPQSFELANIDVDISDERDRDAGILRGIVTDRLLIDNVALVGTRNRHSRYAGDRYTILANISNPDGEGVIRNVDLSDGDITDTSNSPVGHAIGFSADPPHEGKLTWDRCTVYDFTDNGYYLKGSPGENRLINSVAGNCGNGNVRLGTNDKVSTIKINLTNGSNQAHPGSGLWFNGGEPKAEDIIINAHDAGNDVVRVNSGAEGGRIKGLDMECGAGVESPAMRFTSTPETDLQGVTVVDFALRDMSSHNEEDESSVDVSRSDVTLRNGSIKCPDRESIGGSFEATLEDVIF